MFQEITSQALCLNDPLRIIIAGTRHKIIAFLRHFMMISGIAAITALLLMFMKPELIGEFQAISPFWKKEVIMEGSIPAPATAIASNTEINQPANSQSTQLPGNTKQQQSVTNWLSKRYRIANDAANMLVSAAYLTAKEYKLDPLLILSVMAIESGLNPFAESPVGAKGLMQVMAKVHQDKFNDLGGVEAALDPVANIKVGTQILKEYVKRGGSVEAGLKLYVGAALKENDGGYGHKVLAEYKRLKDVSNGKSVPIYTVASVPVKVKEKQIESEEVAAI